MKYKVILYNSGGAEAVDTAGNFSFYTYSQADSFCQRWVEKSSGHRAWLWNGLAWTSYTP
jgi:hypothetical protein